MSDCERLLYCHCAYAKVVPKQVKEKALLALGASGRSFEAVPDLCEMSARKDPALADLASSQGLRIVACYPRAVRWLFHSAGHQLPEETEILNMRAEEPDAWIDAFAGEPVRARNTEAVPVEEENA